MAFSSALPYRDTQHSRRLIQTLHTDRKEEGRKQSNNQPIGKQLAYTQTSTHPRTHLPQRDHPERREFLDPHSRVNDVTRLRDADQEPRRIQQPRSVLPGADLGSRAVVATHTSDPRHGQHEAGQRVEAEGDGQNELLPPILQQSGRYEGADGKAEEGEGADPACWFVGLVESKRDSAARRKMRLSVSACECV